MKSKLFQRLAELPGINWFNKKEKVEYSEEVKPLPTINGGESYSELLYKSERYFKHIQSLKKYIETMNKLLDNVDATVAQWDEIQFNHEQEMEKIHNTSTGHLRNMIQMLESKNKKLEHKLTTQAKLPISDRDVDKLIARLDQIMRMDTGGNKSKEKSKAKQMHMNLHNFLQKLQAHYKQQEEQEKSGSSNPL